MPCRTALADAVTVSVVGTGATLVGVKDGTVTACGADDADDPDEPSADAPPPSAADPVPLICGEPPEPDAGVQATSSPASSTAAPAAVAPCQRERIRGPVLNIAPPATSGRVRAHPPASKGLPRAA